MKKPSLAVLLALLIAGCASGTGEPFFTPQHFDLEPPVYPSGDN